MERDLKISEVEIIPVKPNKGLVAFASFVLNDSLYVGDVAIHTRIDGQGYRLSYPTKTLANGKVLNLVHPINREAGDIILDAVTAKYESLLSKQSGGGS